jgi:hypothetical protein
MNKYQLIAIIKECLMEVANDEYHATIKFTMDDFFGYNASAMASELVLRSMIDVGEGSPTNPTYTLVNAKEEGNNTEFRFDINVSSHEAFKKFIELLKREHHVKNLKVFMKMANEDFGDDDVEDAGRADDTEHSIVNGVVKYIDPPTGDEYEYHYKVTVEYYKGKYNGIELDDVSPTSNEGVDFDSLSNVIRNKLKLEIAKDVQDRI